MTRYVNLRKYAEHDDEVDFVWAPANHYTPPDFPSRLRFLPNSLFMRARILQQARPVLGQLGQLDAVMIHLFEGELLCALRSYFVRGPLLVSSTDEAPIVDRANYPLYPSHLAKPVWRQKLRLANDLWRVRRFDQFIPLSAWVAGILTDQCGAPKENVHPLHVGIDLELWKSVPKAPTTANRLPRILFVGGDFVRKGGALLLEVFRERFQGRAELHLVTKQAPADLPPNVHVYRDFSPNDPRMIELYSTADMMVVPTRADNGPLWVFLEAMAMRLPIIGTDTGSLSEQISDGNTGFIVGIDDRQTLAAAIDKLLSDGALRADMGERGRALVEARYSAAVNVPLILRRMKDAVDASRREQVAATAAP